MSEGDAGIHWLVLAMERAQVGDATGCGLATDAPVGEAWPWVADFLGITEDDVTVAVAQAFHLEMADLSSSQPEALSLLPERHALSYGVLPIRCTDRELVVATSEPLDFDAEREIGFLSGRNTVFVMAHPTAIEAAQPEWYRDSPKTKSVLENVDYAEAVQSVRFPLEVSTRVPAETGEDQIGGVVALIFHEAVKAGVSEVQLTPRGSTGQVLLKEDADSTTLLLRLPVAVLVLVAERIGLLADLPTESEAAFGSLDVFVDDTAYAVSVHLVPGLAGQMLLRIGTDSAAPPGAATGEVWQPETTSSEGHILVVDDDPGGRMLMRTVLEKNGFSVSEADDGTTALPLLQLADDIDAVLLDLMMTSMDGLEVLNRVRKGRKTAGLPVVILTASKDPEDEQRLLRAGADDYLHKPVDPHQLVHRMKAVLKRSRSFLD
ncbi:MAG: response regulator [Gemmatimonadetes bacterium]|nr:response regulator [Gemmatimonadota bacterium]